MLGVIDVGVHRTIYTKMDCILSHCDRKGMLLAHVKMVHPGSHGEDPLFLSWSLHTVFLPLPRLPIFLVNPEIVALVDITLSEVKGIIR